MRETGRIYWNIAIPQLAQKVGTQLTQETGIPMVTVCQTVVKHSVSTSLSPIYGAIINLICPTIVMMK